MEEIQIRDVTDENVDDLCRICILPERRANPTFIKGVEEKRKWAKEMLRAWETFAKVAYKRSAPAGLIQYKPLSSHRAVYIYCIYVPEQEHWRQGIATQLLDSLIGEMRKPQRWLDHQVPLALITKTFPGERPGQYSARSFFIAKGFRQMGEDSNVLYFPLVKGFALTFADAKINAEESFWEPSQTEYVPQDEDKGKAVIIYGPDFCPFAYAFLKKAEAHIQAVAPQVAIRWISKSEDPAEVDKRGGFVGCIVNATPIKSFALDEEGFRTEVREALGIA